MENKNIRLQKFLAEAGIASRRKCEEFIKEGRVIVNGKKITELGTKVDPENDLITFDRKPVKVFNKKVYYMLNKPEKYVTTLNDEFDRPTVLNLMNKVRERVFPVGRLDYDSRGLLLLTNDGDLAYKLTHPRYHVKKTYIAKLKGVPTEEKLDRLRKGVVIDGRKTAPAKIKLKRTLEKNSEIYITIKEGRNRQIRKMFDKIGHQVLKLERISLGKLTIGDLPLGKFRPLSVEELKYVKSLTENIR